MFGNSKKEGDCEPSKVKTMIDQAVEFMYCFFWDLCMTSRMTLIAGQGRKQSFPITGPKNTITVLEMFAIWFYSIIGFGNFSITVYGFDLPSMPHKNRGADVHHSAPQITIIISKTLCACKCHIWWVVMRCQLAPLAAVVQWGRVKNLVHCTFIRGVPPQM
jgi:hypothetical protein